MRLRREAQAPVDGAVSPLSTSVRVARAHYSGLCGDLSSLQRKVVAASISTT